MPKRRPIFAIPLPQEPVNTRLEVLKDFCGFRLSLLDLPLKLLFEKVKFGVIQLLQAIMVSLLSLLDARTQLFESFVAYDREEEHLVGRDRICMTILLLRRTLLTMHVETGVAEE